VKLQLVLGEGSSLVAGEGGFFVASSVQQPTELLHSITFKTFFMWATTQKSATAPAQMKYGEQKKTSVFL
jgi:hypothetical protein